MWHTILDMAIIHDIMLKKSMKDENTSTIFKTIQIRIKLSTFKFYSLVFVKKRETTELVVKCETIFHPGWCLKSHDINC